jgi:hypothetical protein
MHDYIFNTIPEPAYRTCLRATLYSAYWDLGQCRGEKNKLLNVQDDLVTTQKQIGEKDNALLVAQKQINEKDIQISNLKSELDKTHRLLVSDIAKFLKLTLKFFCGE